MSGSDRIAKTGVVRSIRMDRPLSHMAARTDSDKASFAGASMRSTRACSEGGCGAPIDSRKAAANPAS
jgi:hypothetical protein